MRKLGIFSNYVSERTKNGEEQIKRVRRREKSFERVSHVFRRKRLGRRRSRGGGKRAWKKRRKS